MRSKCQTNFAQRKLSWKINEVRNRNASNDKTESLLNGGNKRKTSRLSFATFYQLFSFRLQIPKSTRKMRENY